MRNRAELERARRHLRETHAQGRRAGASVNHLINCGMAVDILSWVLRDEGAHLGPRSFGDLVRQLDAAEGNTPN